VKSRIDALLYSVTARTGFYMRREAELYAYLRETLDSTCYVSCSFGKDSSVLAHAAALARPGIPILMVDPGVPTHWLASERNTWLAYAREKGWNLKLFPWDKWNSKWNYGVNLHKSMFSDLIDYAKAKGLTTRLMGMRVQESQKRRMSFARLGMDAVLRDGTRRILPLALWKTDHVWAYIIKHSLPWLEIYDRAGPDARNGLVGLSGVHNGRMAYLKMYFPDAWKLARELFTDGDLSGA
jgi:3'-phosphoadenosine 5'-phosphosulfate sulfotransferase (PAPS reductase)/FAD synthetase